MLSVPTELDASGRTDRENTLGDEADCRGLIVFPKLSLRDGADLTVKSREDCRLGAGDAIDGEDGRAVTDLLDLNDGLEGIAEGDLLGLIDGLEDDTLGILLGLGDTLRVRDGAGLELDLIDARRSAIRFTVALRPELLRPARPF